MIFKKRIFGLEEDVTEVPPTLTIAIRTIVGQTTNVGLCAVGTLSRACFIERASPPAISLSDTVYNSNQTLLAGNNKYYLIALSVDSPTVYNVQINNSGVITAISTCA